MEEQQWDKRLRVRTTGRVDSHADEYHFPYEPTPYSVLVRLAESGYIHQENKVIDYGCGKGRVGFFLHHEIGCRVTGIEFNAKIYQQAVENQKSYVKPFKPEFVCEDAERYEIKDADVFYFFNPFSVQILESVLGKILESYYENPREMKLLFYYPNDEYLARLMTMRELEFLDEVECKDLFEGENTRERILIFEIRVL